MAIEVFNRYEKKYLLDAETYMQLETRLREHMELDAYNCVQETYPIRNLYYDTADNSLIRTSLLNPLYKEKLRLRSYGEPQKNAKMYVEIKKKVTVLVNKRRSALYPGEAAEFLARGSVEIKPHMNAQVIHEISYLLETQTLKPVVYLSYDRRAYFGIGQHDVRLSFDTNIRTRRYALMLGIDGGEQLLEPGQRIMEIKAARSIPLWLCSLLSEHKIYPVSFSKYGNEYKKHTERNIVNARLNFQLINNYGYPGANTEPAAGYSYGVADRSAYQRGLYQNAQDEKRVSVLFADTRDTAGSDNGHNTACGEQCGEGVFAGGGVFDNSVSLCSWRP
jgi:hypothetical protein